MSGAFRFIDLFAGIGGFHAALSGMGGECVYAVEIDRAAAAVYEHNWGINPLGDITAAANDREVTVPPHDVLAAGFPCQPFSKSGAQRGMDETRGTLYWNILRIIQEHHPAVVLLENVRNLAGPRHVHEWQVIIETLRSEGYRVSEIPSVFSPDLLPPKLGGRPQVRHRVFITATYDPDHLADHRHVEPPVELRPVAGWDPQTWHLETDLPLDPDHHVSGCDLTTSERLWIDAWDDFVVRMWEEREGRRLPGFPLWADSWIPVEELTIPEGTPSWKADFLRKNADFYSAHRSLIDAWTEEWGVYTEAFPPSRRKLEWQAQDTPRLWDCVMHFRPSGIRAKQATYLPALVAITQTSIIGPRERRLSPREAARLQGLPDWFEFPNQSAATTYRQLGNGVSVGAIWHVLKKHAARDEQILKVTNPLLLRSIQTAPDNPDDALGMGRDGRHLAMRGPSPSAPDAVGFRPATDKLEAVNRISALTGSGPETLGKGSKEYRSVLANLARGLNCPVGAEFSKHELAATLAEFLDQPWDPSCWSRGQTITLVGLNRLLEGATHRLGQAIAERGRSATTEARQIVDALAPAIPKYWDGKLCIAEMRDAGDSKWALDEWKGSYFEYQAGICTSLGGQRNALRYLNTTIDYLLERPWDFKAHDITDPQAILNDCEAFDACIQDRGGLGFIVLSGERVIVDGFREWQREDRIAHGKRPRKSKKDPADKQPRYGTAAFIPRKLEVYFFSADDLRAAIDCGALKAKAQPGRNSNGKPRKFKYNLDLRKAGPYLLASHQYAD